MAFGARQTRALVSALARHTQLAFSLPTWARGGDGTRQDGNAGCGNVGRCRPKRKETRRRGH